MSMQEVTSLLVPVSDCDGEQPGQVDDGAVARCYVCSVCTGFQ